MPCRGGQLLIFRGASETAGVGGGSVRPQVEKTSDIQKSVRKWYSSKPGVWPKGALTMAARRRRSYSTDRSLGHNSQHGAVRDLVAAGDWGCCK